MLEAKLRNGRWQMVGTVNGHFVRRSLKLPTGTPKSVAEEIVTRENARLIEERVRGPKAVLTFGEAALFYMRNKGAAYFLNDKSANRQLEILIAELGERKMAEITGADLAAVCDKHYPHCKPQSKKRFVYVWVNAIYRQNADAEKCDLKIFKAPAAGRDKEKPVEPAPEEWLGKFIGHCHDGVSGRLGRPLANGKRVAALALFMTFTAARISEAVRVKPEDIQDRNGDGVLWAYLGMTKPGVPRFAKLHPVLVDALADLDKTPGKPLFGFSDKRSASQAIERVCDHVNVAAGAIRWKSVTNPETGKRRRVKEVIGPLAIEHYSSHKLGRHAFAKRMLDQGHTLAEVQEAGGWLSWGAVSRNYRHLEKSKAQDAAASVRTNLAQSKEGDGENEAKSAA